MLAWVGALLAWGGFDRALVDGLAMLPGAGVVAALLAAAAPADGDSLTVVDLGPAREALPLLALLASKPLGQDGGSATPGL